jgi:oxygen-independent coproporphyrinogen-3 oxidase
MDLESALALEPTHLSCYGLTYEPNTAMTSRLQKGEFEPTDEQVEVEMFELTRSRAAVSGLQHYEISNYAVPGQECRHNLLYWRNAEWWACGPSASGHAAGLRWKNVPRLTTYLEHAPWPPIEEAELISPDQRAGETLMLGLRLRAGIPWTQVDDLLAETPQGARRTECISRWIDRGHLERSDGRLRLTESGLLLADSVISDLI